MILNAYAVLDAFVALLRLPLGIMVIGLGASLWRQWRSAAYPENRGALENRSYLLFLSAFVLVGLCVVSWPLFYLVLNSYVPEWPGAMCIYGVTRVGAGSQGVARFLPGLITAVQLTKPLIVFLAGAWLVLYRINRATARDVCVHRMLILLTVLGIVAAMDSTLETLYLAIPKREEFLTAGCCTAAFDAADYVSRFLPKARIQDSFHPWLYVAYYSVHVTQAALLLGYQSGLGRSRKWLVSALIGAMVSVPVAATFLVEVAAPVLLHLPYHHCVYDLLAQTPESILALALFVGGTFAVGWACVAAWCADRPDVVPMAQQTSRTLARAGAAGYLGSAVMFSVELAVA